MDNLKLALLRDIAISVLEGFWDSVSNIFVVVNMDKEMNKKLEKRNKIASSEKPNKEKKNEKESQVRFRLAQCCLLNGGIFLLSIILFDYILIPNLERVISWILGESAIWSWIQLILKGIFSTIWILPLFLLSKIINTFWFQDIADAAYEYRKGKPSLIPSLSKLLADIVFSLLVQTLFLVQTMALNFIPYIGSFLCWVHMCLLYSLYSFEYKWFNQGYELHKRLTYIETNWPYYLGFGSLLALLTMWSSSFIINGCLFSIFFPLFIISGNESSPSQRIDFPVRFFSLVVSVSNGMFNRKLKNKGDRSSVTPIRTK